MDEELEMEEEEEIEGYEFVIRDKNSPFDVSFQVFPMKGLGNFATGFYSHSGYEFGLYGWMELFPAEHKVVLNAQLSLSDGDKSVALFEGGGFVQKNDNPIVFEYTHNSETGKLAFHLTNLEKGSRVQQREMLKAQSLFRKDLQFQQDQKGGRKKGSRPREKILLYNTIMNLRNSRSWMLRSDSEFLGRYPQYSKGQLEGAKRWFNEGKPGL